jgi:predicted nucleic acid-binding protein
VITVGELELGVLAASGQAERARRADTLDLARHADPVPVSESVMSAWAHLVHACREAGIQRTVKLADSLIAATAITHGLPVVTQDRDYDDMAKAHPLLHVHRV